MSNMLDHQWGESYAADAVLRLVCGRGRIAMREILMFWNAYVDESEDPTVFVLGGYAATAEEWAKFSAEWESLLPFLPSYMGGLFKMSALMASDYYSERALAFYRLIEKHDLIEMSRTFHKQALSQAFEDTEWPASRIRNFQDFESKLKNPYIFAFRAILLKFAEIQNNFGVDQSVDFIFDEKSEKELILPAFDYIRNSVTEDIRAKLGITPVFEKEDRVMPLQAADMLAWLVRIWEHNDQNWADHERPQFPWARDTMLGKGFKVSFSYEDFISEFQKVNLNVRRHLDRLS